MSDSVEYFGIKCHECGFIGSSEESHGGGSMADTGDFEELRCPKCDWVTLHEDPSEGELCNEIVRLRARVKELEGKFLIPENILRMVDAILAYEEMYEGYGFELAKWVKTKGAPQP